MHQVENLVEINPTNALNFIAISHPDAADIHAGPIVIEQQLGPDSLSVPWRGRLPDDEQG